MEDTLPPPPDSGTIRFECDLVGPEDECEAGNYCVPFDPLASGAWTGASCRPGGERLQEAGSPCTVSESPVGGQAGCSQGLACAVATGETSGVCVPLCKLEVTPCEVGECTTCDAGDLSTYGVCLEAIECDGGPCPVAGCVD